MRLFLGLLMMRAFGFLALTMLFHGSAAESAFAMGETSRGSGWKGDGAVVHHRTEASAPKAATNGHSLYGALPSLNWVYKHYRSRRHKHTYSPNKHNKKPGLSPLSSPIQSPSPSIEPSPFNIPIHPPAVSPVSSSSNGLSTPPPISTTVLPLPSPPSSTDSSSISCRIPSTYAVSGSPLRCVFPIKLRLRLSLALYTFIPVLSVFVHEMASITSLKETQVRIIGVDADDQQRHKIEVQVYLIPLEKKFNKTTAVSIHLKLWRKHVLGDSKPFGAWDIIYFHYPGVPPVSFTPVSNNATVVEGPNNGWGGHPPLKPSQVTIPETIKKDSMRESTVLIIALTTFAVFSICLALAAVLLYKHGCFIRQRHEPTTKAPISLKPSASRTSSGTLSFSSSTRTYAGAAKKFNYKDIEKATDRFNPACILGEGGFGLVYSGVLDDGTRVAVKVLKRDDQQGSQEFSAEVEMLSRVHHRNLVKLIGICIEEQARCLIYELISNGSVESHLHGVDKERSPLDWAARMKIALGAARALAYLHEDSDPCVIHSDFKSSNILLEDDFNPKVSDFGLAKAAIDEVVKHTSTRLMGTFGYLAPEYAMTGHLLVKSDVYSYGVVLLELLTGRQPVDSSQPPGQETLVAWVRPLLTMEKCLHELLDPTLNSTVLMDSVAKVAAIASMCVQPEVTHRPFMGEVVQALKLVCNEFDELQELEAKLFTHHELLPPHVENKGDPFSGELGISNCGVLGHDSEDGAKVIFSARNLATLPMGVEGMDNAPSRTFSSSGPLRVWKRRNFWRRLF